MSFTEFRQRQRLITTVQSEFDRLYSQLLPPSTTDAVPEVNHESPTSRGQMPASPHDADADVITIENDIDDDTASALAANSASEVDPDDGSGPESDVPTRAPIDAVHTVNVESSSEDIDYESPTELFGSGDDADFSPLRVRTVKRRRTESEGSSEPDIESILGIEKTKPHAKQKRAPAKKGKTSTQKSPATSKKGRQQESTKPSPKSLSGSAKPAKRAQDTALSRTPANRADPSALKPASITTATGSAAKKSNVLVCRRSSGTLQKRFHRMPFLCSIYGSEAFYQYAQRRPLLDTEVLQSRIRLGARWTMPETNWRSPVFLERARRTVSRALGIADPDAVGRSAPASRRKSAPKKR